MMTLPGLGVSKQCPRGSRRGLTHAQLPPSSVRGKLKRDPLPMQVRHAALLPGSANGFWNETSEFPLQQRDNTDDVNQRNSSVAWAITVSLGALPRSRRKSRHGGVAKQTH